MEEREERKAVDKMYEQRNRLIIIGLAGRTGAGCSTVASILRKDSMEELDLRNYKTRDFNSADERKYSVVRKFMGTGTARWKGFLVIEASSIIYSFLLEKGNGKFAEYLNKLNNKNSSIPGLEELEGKLGKFLEENNEINTYISDSNPGRLNIDDANLDNAVRFFTEELPKMKAKFKAEAERYTCRNKNDDNQESNLYSYLMQMWGNNIRSSGDVFEDGYKTGNETKVAERIDEIVRLICRSKEKEQDQRVRICIDAFRNPYEIHYFRDRYRAFYLFAVSTEDGNRRGRLMFRQKELDSLDSIEYPSGFGDKQYEMFFHQNIGACLEIADVYLYNPDVGNYKYYEMTEQILKYIALILQPGLVTPTHMERCMQLAFNAKYNSGCLSRQVGAVVTGEDFSIRSVGWNDVPKGQVTCNLRCVEDYCENKDEESFSEYELTDENFHNVMHKIYDKLREVDSGDSSKKPYAYCFKGIYNGLKCDKNQVYTRALHAEENAFLQIAKYGGATVRGGKLFVTASPCELCSKKAYQLGIREIYYIDPYPGIAMKHILKFGKKDNPKLILFSGAIGNAYIALFSPRIPYKDELELYTGISAKQVAREIVEAGVERVEKDKKPANEKQPVDETQGSKTTD